MRTMGCKRTAKRHLAAAGVLGPLPGVIGTMMAGKGDLLPVSAFPPDGTWPIATTQWEKRNIALEIPVWDPDICIQCNKCALVCPHSAIRAKVYEPAALEGAPETFKAVNYKAKDFFLWIDMFETHEPWLPPRYLQERYDPKRTDNPMCYPTYGWADPYTKADLRNMRALYAGEVTDRPASRTKAAAKKPAAKTTAAKKAPGKNSLSLPATQRPD